MPRLASLIKPTGQLLLATLVVLVAAELFTRAFLASPSGSVYHPLLGSVWQAHQPMLHATEGFTRFRTNNIGLNDDDTPAVPPVGTRVLVLGDSYTEAQQVPRTQNFVERTDVMLGDNIHLLNAGRSGIQPLTTLPLLQTYAPHFMPHHVLLMVNHSDYAELKASTGATIHYDDAGAITHFTREAHSPEGLRWKVQNLMRQSALLTLGLKRSKKIFQKAKDEWYARLGIDRAPEYLTNDVLFYNTTGPQSLEEQAYFMPRAVFALKELLANLPEGVTLDVVYIPAFEYAPKGALSQNADDVAIEAFFTQAAYQADTSFTVLTETFAQAYAQNGLPLAGFHNGKSRTSGHLNAEGHKVVAGALVRLLR